MTRKPLAPVVDLGLLSKISNSQNQISCVQKFRIKCDEGSYQTDWTLSFSHTKKLTPQTVNLWNIENQYMYKIST